MNQRLDYNSFAPDGMKALGGVHAYVGRCGLPKELIDLVYLRVSQINGCAYCIDLHSRDLLAAGVGPDKLALVPVWREGGALFDARERAALAWAESVTRVDRGVGEEAYGEAAAAFTPRELADLTIAVGLINAYNRLAIPFRAPPKGAAAS